MTHDIQEALKLGTKVLIMDQGQIQQFDTPENIIKYPANNFVKNSFLKTSPNLDNNFLYNFLPK